LAVNVPLADPDPAGIVQGCADVPTTIWPLILLVMVHGPTVSEGRPSTLTVTIVPGKPATGEIVIEGSTVNVAVPLSASHVTVRV
jgi:hypothetical protein